MRRLSRQEIDEICALIEAGEKRTDIATRFGVNRSTIGYHGLMLGAESPNPVRPMEPYKPSMRNGVQINPFNRDEDALILALNSQQFNPGQIARTLTQRWPGRPRKSHTILARLATLARRQARMEDEH